jgi:glycerophosphoryl diester phosphodiesterase
MKVSGIEFDVQISRDDVPFLYHNDELGDGLLGKSCPRDQKIKNLDFSEIQGHCFLSNGEDLPLLAEALDLLSSFDGHLFIDLKQKASSQFYQIIENASLLQRPKLRFLSFKKRTLRPLRDRWPNAETILLSRYIPRGLFYEGAGLNSRLGFFAPFFRWIGKDTALWTMNSRSEVLRALDKKVDFVITDHYELCKSLL